MKTIKKTIILSLVFCAVFIFAIPQQISAQISSEAARLLRSANVQIFYQPARSIDFTLPLLAGGNASLSSFKGRVVLLNFWTSWCPACSRGKPSMEVLHQRFNNHWLDIIAVNLMEDTNTVRQYIQRHGYTFRVMLDNSGTVGSNYDIRGIPTTFVIDRQGLIVGVVSGAIDWSSPQMIAGIEALLNSR